MATVKKVKIRVLYFGMSRDLVMKSDEFLDLEVGMTIKRFREELLVLYPQLNQMAEFSLALNESYSNDDMIISHNDVLAIIPPVSGG